MTALNPDSHTVKRSTSSNGQRHRSRRMRWTLQLEALGETNETMPVTPAEFVPDPKRWFILAVVVVATLMVVLDASIVTIALPSAQRSLHISVANRQWVITAYTLGLWRVAAAGWSYRRLRGPTADVHRGTDRLRSRLGAWRRGCRSSHALRFPSAAGCLCRADGSCGPVDLDHHLFNTTPGNEPRPSAPTGRSRVPEPRSACWLGGVLTQYASWRWCLLHQRSDRLAGSGRGVPGHRRIRASGTTHYDIPGALLSTAGLVSLVYGFTKAVTDGWSSTPTLTLIAVGVILLAAFVVVEARSANPLLPLRIVLERNRGGSYLAATLLGGGYLRHVHLHQLLHADDSWLLSSQSRRRLPSVRTRRDRGRGGCNEPAAQDRTSHHDDRRPSPRCLGSAVADPDRGAHVVLDAPLSATDRHEPRNGSGLPRSEQYRADQGARARLWCRERGGEFDSASRCVPGRGAPQHHRRHRDGHLPRISRTATGRSRHWFTGSRVALAVGAIIVAAGAVVSAVLVNAKATDLVGPATEPALSEA